MGAIQLKNVRKKFGNDVVIDNLNLEIKDGSFTVLVGPSGCGKSTTLRMITGLDEPTSGDILIDGHKINDLTPGKRDIAMVFQNYALYPTMTIRENIEFGLENKKVPKEERQRRVKDICEIVGLTEYLDRKPSTLSGGQRQRVALARAMVKQPKVFLMDEPLSNLDAKLRIEMRSAIRDVQKQVGITTVYVTHDQEEALAISDRVAVMKLGVIQQIGSPRDIYARPCNAFVSTFIGHSNLFFGTIRKQGSVPSVVFEGGYHVEMPNLVDTVTEGQRVVVSVRPEEFSLNQEGMDCEIISRTFLGKYTNYFLRFGEGMVLEDQPSIEYSQDLGHVDRIFAVGEKIRLRPNPNKINVFTQDMEQSLIKDVKRYDE